MTALICALVAGSALFYIFYLPGKAVYENLRDLNFEYKAGKLPDADYQSLKSSLEEEAATVLAEIAHLEKAGVGHPLRNEKGARI